MKRLARRVLGPGPALLDVERLNSKPASGGSLLLEDTRSRTDRVLFQSLGRTTYTYTANTPWYAFTA